MKTIKERVTKAQGLAEEIARTTGTPLPSVLPTFPVTKNEEEAAYVVLETQTTYLTHVLAAALPVVKKQGEDLAKALEAATEFRAIAESFRKREDEFLGHAEVAAMLAGNPTGTGS